MTQQLIVGCLLPFFAPLLFPNKILVEQPTDVIIHENAGGRGSRNPKRSKDETGMYYIIQSLFCQREKKTPLYDRVFDLRSAILGCHFIGK
jgi:hypothetical protein